MLAALVDVLESRDVEVTAATPSVDKETGDIVADLTVRLPDAVDVDSDSTETAVVSTDLSMDTDPVDTRVATTASTGTVECSVDDCDATFDTERGMKIHFTRVHLPGIDAADDDLPPYRNPSALRRVYDPDRTFEAMTRELGVDVSPATVRRYMIKFGIHDPDSYGGEEQDEPVPTLDGDLTVDEVRNAVLQSSTVYDVERHLDLDHDEALAVLRDLDLLELVHGRVADRPDTESLETAVDQRLRRSRP